MSKGTLYFIIVVLLGILFYLLFVPQQTVEAPVETSDSEKAVSETGSEPALFDDTESDPTADETSIRTGTIEFTGELVGFGDGKDQILGSYKTALINDGIEVLAIDLRPLVGYDVTNLETDLGVTVGSTVTVQGSMVDGIFVISALR